MLKNGEGSYVADQQTLDMLEGEGRVVARYAGGNPNGSQRAIAGVTNEAGNVVGLMPHPEHAVEDLCGPGTDGLGFFTSVVAPLQRSPERPPGRASAAPGLQRRPGRGARPCRSTGEPDRCAGRRITARRGDGAVGPVDA